MKGSIENIADAHSVYQIPLAKAKATAKRTGATTVGFAIVTGVGVAALGTLAILAQTFHLHHLNPQNLKLAAEVLGGTGAGFTVIFGLAYGLVKAEVRDYRLVLFQETADSMILKHIPSGADGVDYVSKPIRDYSLALGTVKGLHATLSKIDKPNRAILNYSASELSKAQALHLNATKEIVGEGKSTQLMTKAFNKAANELLNLIRSKRG